MGITGGGLQRKEEIISLHNTTEGIIQIQRDKYKEIHQTHTKKSGAESAH